MSKFIFFKKAFLQFVLWSILILSLMAPLAWWSIHQPEHLQHFSTIVTQNSIFFITFRWLFILTVWLCWPSVIRTLNKRYFWPYEKVLFWLNQRIRVVIWLILFEILVCENIVLMLIRLIEGRV